MGRRLWCCSTGLYWAVRDATGKCCEQEPQHCLSTTHNPTTLLAEPVQEKPEERVTPVAVDMVLRLVSSSSAAGGAVIQRPALDTLRAAAHDSVGALSEQTGMLEVNDLQSVSRHCCVSCRPVPHSSGLLSCRLRCWGLWAGHAMCEGQVVEKLNGSGATST